MKVAAAAAVGATAAVVAAAVEAAEGGGGRRLTWPPSTFRLCCELGLYVRELPLASNWTTQLPLAATSVSVQTPLVSCRRRVPTGSLTRAIEQVVPPSSFSNGHRGTGLAAATFAVAATAAAAATAAEPEPSAVTAAVAALRGSPPASMRCG